MSKSLVVSYLPWNSDRKTYLTLSKRITAKPSFVFDNSEANEKLNVVYKKKLYVPAYDFFDVRMSDGINCWKIHINFLEHNVVRKRGNKDVTWNVDKWLSVVQSILQSPHEFKSNEVKVSVDKIRETTSLLLKMRFFNVDEQLWDSVLSNCRLELVDETNSVANVPPVTLFFMDCVQVNNQSLVLFSRSNNLQRVKDLITRGNLDINYCDESSKWTALHWACYNGHIELCQYLTVDLRTLVSFDGDSFSDLYKVNLDVLSQDGSAPIHLAAMRGFLDIVLLLESCGANTTIVNNNGENIGDIAMRYRHLNVVEWYFRNGGKGKAPMVANVQGCDPMPADLTQRIKFNYLPEYKLKIYGNILI